MVAYTRSNIKRTAREEGITLINEFTTVLDWQGVSLLV